MTQKRTTLIDFAYRQLKHHPRLFTALNLVRSRPVISLDYPVTPISRYGHGRPSHPQLQQIITQGRERYAEQLQKVAAQQASLHQIPASFWVNDFMPALDAASLYAMTATRKPARYFEVGSGVSTRFVKRAITDHNLPTRITSFDPEPRADINALCDVVIRKPLEQTDLSIFQQLQRGDILFIDNSHQSFQNSDVTVFFLDILPNLSPGVLVGIHDILLPDDYPPSYAQNYYSEQYLLACWLLGGGKNMKIVLPNWFASQDQELSKITEKLFTHPSCQAVDTHGSIFWFKISAA